MEYTQADEQIAQSRGLTVDRSSTCKSHAGLQQRSCRAFRTNAAPRPTAARVSRPPTGKEAFRLLQERDDQGVIPPNALPNALSQLDSTRTGGRTATRGRRHRRVGRSSRGRSFHRPPASTLTTPGGPRTAQGTSVAGRAQCDPSHHPQHHLGGKCRWRCVAHRRWWNELGTYVDDLMANLCALAMDPTNPNNLLRAPARGFRYGRHPRRRYLQDG